ncbi:U4/U6-U5 snRNP complex subunit SNU23 [Rhodotorula paludigena]|uniref:U4/U6-U5 snRNP complex subunit SNU23 n=1 Tax=Rhodotorula paludigena TaxID=86838 RepID=UPI003180A01E
MSGKVGAYGANSKSDTSFRKTWDQKEYEEKAREKDKEAHEAAQLAEEYAKKGKKPPRKQEDLPKATELMQAREAPLELDKNLNKTIVIDASAGSGQKQPGFYCDVCRRTCKDSVRYLDHLNGRGHLRRLGQTTKVVKSTLNDVRQKIAELRAKSAAAAEKKQYDFEQRIKDIKAAEVANKEAEREAKRRKKEEEKQKAEAERNAGADQDMMAAMGFGSFGGGAKR